MVGKRLSLLKGENMEDRYLFKAKRLDNGEWVQGVPFEIEGKTVILINDNENYLRVHYLEENMWNAAIYAIEVDSSTICQYTGLKAENGKLIWENDIVKFDIYYYRNLASSTISQIKWCNELCTLSLVVNDRGTRGTLGHLMDLNKEIKVIGNIFDNPELLESEE